jgi:hypothetical protein
MGADFALDRPGRYRITLDVPDQLLLCRADLLAAKPLYPAARIPEPTLWLTFAAGMDVVIDEARVAVQTAAPAVVLPAALASRRFMLKGYFSAMSEPRPWTLFRPHKDLIETLRKNRSGMYLEQTSQMLETLEICHAMAPEDPVVRQYYQWVYRRLLGDLPPVSIDLAESAHAPPWAALAHRAYVAASAVPRWWLANRLLPSGELGGAIQDDSDFYQQLVLFPMIEDAPLGRDIRKGAAALSHLAMETSLDRGLNRRRMDLLHAYEEGINHLATTAFWYRGDPVHFERAMQSAASIMALTVTGPDGNVYFTGEDFAAADLDGERHARGHEHMYHSLLMHPLYEVALYNRNPRVMAFFADYVRTRQRFQKPGKWANGYNFNNAGEPGGFVNRPGAYYAGEPWLALYELTGDAAYLEPFRLGIENGIVHFRRWKRWSKLLLAPELQPFMKQRFAADPRVCSGYNGFLLTGDKGMLADDLRKTIDEYERFPHMYTTAEPYTDRVLPTNLPPVMLAYLGITSERNYWTHDLAVSYEGRGSDFSALVYPTPRNQLRVAIFSFANEPRTAAVRTWRLPHGRYQVRLGPDADDDGALDSVSREAPQRLYRGARVEVVLPPQRLTLLDITPLTILPSIFARPDLALSSLDSSRAADGTATVRVHNIGSATASQVSVTLMRNGERVATKVIEELAAPLDLKPRIAVLTFGRTEIGDQIVIDPDAAIDEINTDNNQLQLD